MKIKLIPAIILPALLCLIGMSIPVESASLYHEPAESPAPKKKQSRKHLPAPMPTESPDHSKLR